MGSRVQAVVGSLFTAHLEVAPDTMRQLLHAADLLQVGSALPRGCPQWNLLCTPLLSTT